MTAEKPGLYSSVSSGSIRMRVEALASSQPCCPRYVTANTRVVYPVRGRAGALARAPGRPVEPRGHVASPQPAGARDGADPGGARGRSHGAMRALRAATRRVRGYQEWRSRTCIVG